MGTTGRAGRDEALGKALTEAAAGVCVGCLLVPGRRARKGKGRGEGKGKGWGEVSPAGIRWRIDH
jgi:hypothetical protein